MLRLLKISECQTRNEWMLVLSWALHNTRTPVLLRKRGLILSIIELHVLMLFIPFLIRIIVRLLLLLLMLLMVG